MGKTEVTKRRWLLIPVETKARELAAKTLLACAAAEKGWGVIVGEKKIVRGKQDRLPRGTFIEKSISPGRISDIERAKSAGNRVSAWCEEGLIYINREEYAQRRLEAESFAAVDYFFAWGKQQANDLAEILGANEKVIISGNPRFDLLRPELRGIFTRSASEIRRRFGNIILINTKFSDVNNNRNIHGFDFVSFLCSEGKIRTRETENLMRRYVRFNEKIFSCFQKLVPVLAREFGNKMIIIRPHPSESHAPWLELAKKLPNVKVIFEGNVSEWLLAADIMIHNNCTTGVEAFLLERPSISYRPLQDAIVEHELPNEVSFQAFSEEELLRLVRRFVENGNNKFMEERARHKVYAQQYIASMEGNLACDTIIDHLNNLDLPYSESKFPLRKDYTSILKNKAIKVRKFIKQSLEASKKHDLTLYYRQKFPGVTLEEMISLRDEMGKASGRFAGVQIAPVDENTFCFFCP